MENFLVDKHTVNYKFFVEVQHRFDTKYLYFEKKQTLKQTKQNFKVCERIFIIMMMMVVIMEEGEKRQSTSFESQFGNVKRMSFW